MDECAKLAYLRKAQCAKLAYLRKAQCAIIIYIIPLASTLYILGFN